MPESKSHNTTANRIARKYKTEYNQEAGADIVTSKIVVEVEPPETVSEALAQLRGYRKPVYIAGTNQEAVDKALEITKGTSVGVMNNQGNIVKRSSRKTG